MRYHLGCGSIYLPGYVNVDFPMSNHTVNIDIPADIYADILTMPLQRCQEIRSSHVFEHFNYVDSMYLLCKWYMSLEVGGMLRINIPDVEQLSEALKDASVEKSFRIIRYLYGSHEDSWAYHINGWTGKTLSYTLSSIGFLIKEVNKTGDINSPYPNCSVEIISEKKEEKDRSALVCSTIELFKLYKNGDTNFENRLESYFKDKFTELFR